MDWEGILSGLLLLLLSFDIDYFGKKTPVYVSGVFAPPPPQLNP